jgi:threonine dehydrogenase-like Zn-dependent dehydrogenase
LRNQTDVNKVKDEVQSACGGQIDFLLCRQAKEKPMTGKVYGVIILGSGPAGLQAAIHAARAKVSVLVMGKPAKSSLHRAHIENYCCMERTAGEDLLQQGIKAGRNSGAEHLFWPWGFPAINSEYREKKNCWGVE